MKNKPIFFSFELISIFTALALALPSCGESQTAQLDRIKKNFLAHQQQFEQLNTRISTDAKNHPKCFEVRLRWADWGEPQRDRASYYKISEARYAAYKTLLKKTGANMVSNCPPTAPDNPGWTRITVALSGIAVSGCTTSLDLNSDNSIPQTEITPGYQHKEIPLIDGWYISHHCT